MVMAGAVAVTHPGGADDVSEREVHPYVAIDQDPIVGLAILELNQHGVILACPEQREWQL
jgi:hypothetical protein